MNLLLPIRKASLCLSAGRSTPFVREMCFSCVAFYRNSSPNRQSWHFRSSIPLIESSLDCSWRGFVCMVRYFWSHCRALVNAFLLSFSIWSGDVFLMCRILLKFFAKPTIYDFRSSMLLIKSSLDCSWRGFVCMLKYFWSHCRALLSRLFC